MREMVQSNRVVLKQRQRIYLKIKRILDILCALAGMLVLSPVFLVTAVAIKLEDPSGSVIHRQTRIGYNGRPFIMYKFRSMRMETPILSTNEFHNVNLYVTRVGRFIRYTSIDELPQFLNVLLGNMSMVGPRPLLSRERNVHIRRFYYGLYQVRPGITGMAQTNGRDDMSDREKVQWDRTYLEHISFLTDLKILAKTVVKVIRKEGVLDKDGSFLCAEEAEQEAFSAAEELWNQEQ